MGLGFYRGFCGSREARAAAQVLDMVVLDAVHVPGHVCMYARACVCVQRALLSVSTSQQTKQQCQPGDITAGWRLRLGTAHPSVVPGSPSPRPVRLQPPGKSLSPPLLLFGLSAKRSALQTLGSSAITSCLCGLLPAPGVGTDPALLPLCPIPVEQCRNVPQGGEAREAAGNTGEQEGQRCLASGAATEAWAPLLPSFSYQPVPLSLVEVSSGFACARAGLTLPRDHAAPRRGRLSLQQVKL